MAWLKHGKATATMPDPIRRPSVSDVDAACSQNWILPNPPTAVPLRQAPGPFTPWPLSQQEKLRVGPVDPFVLLMTDASFDARPLPPLGAYPAEDDGDGVRISVTPEHEPAAVQRGKKVAGSASLQRLAPPPDLLGLPRLKSTLSLKEAARRCPDSYARGWGSSNQQLNPAPPSRYITNPDRPKAVDLPASWADVLRRGPTDTTARCLDVAFGADNFGDKRKRLLETTEVTLVAATRAADGLADPSGPGAARDLGLIGTQTPEVKIALTAAVRSASPALSLEAACSLFKLGFRDEDARKVLFHHFVSESSEGLLLRLLDLVVSSRLSDHRDVAAAAAAEQDLMLARDELRSLQKSLVRASWHQAKKLRIKIAKSESTIIECEQLLNVALARKTVIDVDNQLLCAGIRCAMMRGHAQGSLSLILRAATALSLTACADHSMLLALQWFARKCGTSRESRLRQHEALLGLIENVKGYDCSLLPYCMHQLFTNPDSEGKIKMVDAMIVLLKRTEKRSRGQRQRELGNALEDSENGTVGNKHEKILRNAAWCVCRDIEMDASDVADEATAASRENYLSEPRSGTRIAQTWCNPKARANVPRSSTASEWLKFCGFCQWCRDQDHSAMRQLPHGGARLRLSHPGLPRDDGWVVFATMVWSLVFLSSTISLRRALYELVAELGLRNEFRDSALKDMEHPKEMVRVKALRVFSASAPADQMSQLMMSVLMKDNSPRVKAEAASLCRALELSEIPAIKARIASLP